MKAPAGPAARAAGGGTAGGPVTIDLDVTDVEVCGRKKRGVAYNHQGQRVGRPHVAAWAEMFIDDAIQSGDTELAEFFGKTQADSRKGDELAKGLPRARLG
jgi:hypothetical protein